MSSKTDKREAEMQQLADRSNKMVDEIKELHLELRRYRIALNRIAHPKSWGVNPGFHEEIARRALIIGQPVAELPPGAAIVATPKPEPDIEPGPWTPNPKES
jgi:hypothetical protein